MMKRILHTGGGVMAILLASMVLFGCSSMDESVEEHREGADKYEHVWEATYDVEAGKYIRSALQFGSGGDKLDKVKVKVKTIYPQNGKAGLMFGLYDEKSADGENTLYNTYFMGIGEKVGGSETLDIYIDYMKGLVTLKEGEDNAEKVAGKQTEITGNQTISVPDRKSGDPLTVVAEISYDKSTVSDENKGKYTVKLTNEAGTTTYATVSWNHGEKVNGTDISSSVGSQALGTIASYGMVSAATAGEKKVDIRWNVDQESLPSGTVLAADAE